MGTTNAGTTRRFYIEVGGTAGYNSITGSMERHEFSFAKILDWICQTSSNTNMYNNL
jgi:hypothetical protein